MRMHEWMKYRDRQIRRALREADEEGDPAVPQEPLAGADSPQVAHEAAQTAVATRDDAPVESTAGASAPTTPLEVLESIGPTGDSMRQRLEAILARQGQLPFEIVPTPKPAPGETRRVVESRDELVSRLLDPTLTLQETALLLGVCPTTVRRYTNRGALRCMRTPGNQRRFRLSDILEFLEHRENWA